MTRAQNFGIKIWKYKVVQCLEGQYLQFLVARVCTKLVLHCTKDARFQKAFNDKLVITRFIFFYCFVCLNVVKIRCKI